MPRVRTKTTTAASVSSTAARIEAAEAPLTASVTNMPDAPPTPILRCRTADITASADAQRLINTVRHFPPSLSVTTLGVDHYWYSQFA